jgi:ABC-type Na+ efflux pump permease subunit
MAVWTLAKKEARSLLRDPLVALVLLALPLLFILLLGLLVGEDDRLRVSLVDLDQGKGLTAGESWAKAVQRDLAETAGIKVEILPSVEEARRLVADHKRAAVLVFRPTFSDRVSKCSFLVDGINPFHRDGVYLDKVHAELIKDEKQPGSAAIIEQVAQVTLLRVILPYMIGRAFDRLSDPDFIQILGHEVRLPVPAGFEFVFGNKVIRAENGEKRVMLGTLLELAAGGKEASVRGYEEKVGEGVQSALKRQFENYNLRGKTWAALTKSKAGENRAAEASSLSSGLSGQRFQWLVPSYSVMFAFFLAVILGWAFVAERRQGTLKRLRAAPLTGGQLLTGKLLPYYALSVAQGVFLLVAGRWVFGMSWGSERWPLAQQAAWLLLVVTATSFAATGLALLVAALVRTELQVALYGAVPVLALALVGGCVLPPELMPERVQPLTRLTPNGWALLAYRELLGKSPSYDPNVDLVLTACAVLAGFGAAFFALAWGLLRLD